MVNTNIATPDTFTSLEGMSGRVRMLGGFPVNGLGDSHGASAYQEKAICFTASTTDLRGIPPRGPVPV